MKAARRSSRLVWRWPLLLAGATIAGLLSALLGQRGAWLPLCWVLLAAPLAVLLMCVKRRRVGAVKP